MISSHSVQNLYSPEDNHHLLSPHVGWGACRFPSFILNLRKQHYVVEWGRVAKQIAAIAYDVVVDGKEVEFAYRLEILRVPDNPSQDGIHAAMAHPVIFQIQYYPVARRALRRLPECAPCKPDFKQLVRILTGSHQLLQHRYGRVWLIIPVFVCILNSMKTLVVKIRSLPHILFRCLPIPSHVISLG